MDAETDGLPGAIKPQTWKVLTLLVVAAGTFSYLGAFAVTGALAQANVIRPIPKNPDPRPIWALTAFCAMLLASSLIAVLMRYLSRRQFRSIDEMLEEDGDLKK